MERIITLLAGLSLAAASPSVAQINQKVTSRTTDSSALSANAAKHAKGRILSVKVTPSVGKYIKAPKAEGQVVELLNEDFSLMATGSYGSPDLTQTIWKDSEVCPCGWQNLKEGYTHTPLWGCEYVYPAGGTAYLRADSKKYSYARLNTPMLDCEDNDNVAYLEFDARTKEGLTLDDIYVQFAETNNMGKLWGNSGGGLIGHNVTDTWNTYTVEIEGTGPTTIFGINSSTEFNGGNPAGVYIDNIRVYQTVPVISRPEALPHSEYKGTSFVANWKPVENAAKYHVDVYTQAEGEEPRYLFRKFRSEGTSLLISGVASGETYYYTVAAVDAEGNESRESFPIQVFDIEPPVLTETGINDKGIYTASWNEVPSAEVYNYYAAFKRTVKEDGPINVTDEDMDHLTFDGAETDFDPQKNPGTFDEDFPGVYERYNISEMQQGAWTGTKYTPCKGYAGIDAWFHVVNPEIEPMGSLESPELNLEKDNGNLKVSLKLASQGIDMEGWTEANGDVMHGIHYVRAAVAVFTYDESAGDFVQKDVRYQDVTADWENYEFDLTGAGERSIIGIFATRIPGMLFVDDIKITQNAQKGDVYNEPFLYKRYYQEGTSIDVEVPLRAKDEEVWHKVCGVKGQVFDEGNQEITAGQYSEYRKVGIAEHTDIQTALQSKMLVTLDGNTLRVANPAGKDVEVYTPDGRQIHADRSGKANVSTVLPGRGTYLVKVGSNTVKLAY